MTIAASLIGAGANYLNGRNAANTQKQIASQNLANQKEEFGKLAADAQPFLNSANTALGNLTPAYNQEQSAYSALQDPSKTFHTDPGYNFAMNQGTQAVEGSSALNGLLNSGSAVKALNNYAQGQADQQYGNYYNRLQGKFQDASGIYGQQQSTAQGLGGTALGSIGNAISGTSNALNSNATAQSNAAMASANNTGNLISSLSTNPQVSTGLNSLLTQAMNTMKSGTGGTSYSGGGGGNNNTMTGVQTYTI